MNLTEVEWFRAALINAQQENITLEELILCIEHASCAEKFDDAVNLLIRMKNG